MTKGFENFSAMLKSADSDESAESSGRIHSQRNSEQLNSNEKPFGIQRKINKIRIVENRKIEQKEYKIVEQELDKQLKTAFETEITSLGIEENKDMLEDRLSKNLAQEKILSKADEAIVLKNSLTGKESSEKILQILISKYENEESLKTWVENWKNFLELWKFAQDKPPAERKAIENIISNSNFTAENSFDLALSEIEKSSDISAKTKLDIQRKFKTTGINTVNDFDRTLKNEKQYKKDIEKQIQTRNTDIENLTNEIDNLSAELKNLPPNDPKRKEIQKQIEQKSELLKIYEQELSELNEAKPKNIQFQLRNDLLAILNSDGSRSIKMLNENFTIQLPKNSFLMGMKNLRSINVAFPFMALRTQNMDNEIFTPNLQNGGIPDKNQRKMGHLILSELGYNDDKILSENEITQLKKDLSVLSDKYSGKTGRECLVELGIYDVASQNVNKTQLKKALQFIRENRGKEVNFKKLKGIR